MLERPPPPVPAVEMRGASGGYGGRPVLEGLDLALPAGRMTALCGPNGCGKSTVLRLMRRSLPEAGGAALLRGEPMERLRAEALAREMAMLSQSPSAPPELTVREVVAMGRYAWGPRGAHSAVEAALRRTGLAALADRPLGTLSGGQRQRAWIAMVIAQEAPVILLDEPINHLDIAHALETLDLLRDLTEREGRTVGVVLHDLNLAAAHAHDIAFLREGRVVAHGPVERVFTKPVIDAVFGLDCEVVRPPGGRPWCLPRRAPPAIEETTP